MFGKTKEQNAAITPDAPVVTTAPQIQHSGKQEVTTLLCEGVRFEGNMFAPSNTRIDGEVKGNINGQTKLMIGEKGKINGDLNAVDITVLGQVEGNIKCHKLELKKGSRVNGDIFTEILITELGMSFNGRCVMENKKEHTNPIPNVKPESKN